MTANREQIEFHPIADTFPLLSKDRLNELADSIRDKGLLHPIILFEGKILDGRNRYLACQVADIKPHFEEFKVGNPWLHVWSTNCQRRDITEDLRALIWIRINEGLIAYQKTQDAIRAEANKKRSEATKQQPRTEDGTRLTEKPGCTTISGTTRSGHRKGEQAKAQASNTNRGAIARAGEYQRQK